MGRGGWMIVMAVGCALAGACSSTAPTAPELSAKELYRPASAFGWVTAVNAATTNAPVPATVPGTAGPIRAQVGNRTVDVPAALPVDRHECDAFYPQGPDFRGGNTQPVLPCWAQVGLAADGHTVTWIRSFGSRTEEDPSSPDGVTTRPSYSGEIRGVVDANIVFADHTTIPIGTAVPPNCGAPTETTTGIEGMRGGELTVDSETGTAIEFHCPPGLE